MEQSNARAIKYKLKNGITLKLLQDSTKVDGLGGEIWSGAYVLAQYLEESISVAGKNVIELGAGCGLCGLVAAALGSLDVVLTDEYPDLLLHNIELNSHIEMATIKSQRLVWGENQNISSKRKFDIILGSEITQLGRKEHTPLLDTIKDLSHNQTEAYLSMDACSEKCIGKCDISKCTCSHFVFRAEENNFFVTLVFSELLFTNTIVRSAVGVRGQKKRIDRDDRLLIFQFRF